MDCERYRMAVESAARSSLAIRSTDARKRRSQSAAKWLRYFVLLVSILSPGLLLAQQSGSINGSVTDPSGDTVPNAQITLTRMGQGTVFHATSNSAGEYSFPALEAGSYSLQVVAAGFEQFEAAGIVLRVSRTERVDAKLTVGSVNTKVEVSGEGLGTVQTESPEISFTITGKQITQLVLNGRNFSQLVTLSPGVINQTGQDEGQTGVGGSVSYSINGGRTEYNNWELDGSSLMDNGSNSTLNVYPDVDAIAETQVLTSNYGAQYGRNASGTVLAQTKSGTESFHGNVFEFLRNDAFNARNYFQTSVPTYKKHDYGFTIGGPVRIPKLYTGGERKTFFFYSQEWRHENVPGTVFNQQVPSDAERSGNFSDLCYQVTNPDPTGPPTVLNSDCPVDPTTGAQFPGNQVPIDPNGNALLALIPAANVGSGTSSFFRASPSQLTTNREELFRIDQVVSPKLRGFFRFIYDSWATVSNPPTFQSNSFPTVQNSFAGPGIDMVANLTYAATPSLVNEFVADYTTDHITLINTTPGISRQNFTGTGFFDNGYGNVLPSINVAGNSAYGGGFNVNTGYFPWQNSNPTYSYRDNLTKTFRNHTFIMGATYIAAQKNEPSVGNNQGSYSFNTSSGVTTGNAFADLLVGRVANFTQSSAQPKYYNRYKILEPYFQDNWRATPKLTLNLGLRLSLFGTYRDISKQSGNFEPSVYSAAAAPQVNDDGSITSTSPNLFNGIVICGTSGTPPGCMSGHLFNPAPRVGFAYDPTGNGKLSIRGGYGVFFEHTNGNESNSEYLESTAPVVQNPSRSNFVGFNAGGTALTQFPLNVIQIPTHAIWPYVQQYNLAVQGQMPGHTTLQVAYVGSVSRHLPVRHEGNQLEPISPLENPYGPGQSISKADCDPSNITVVSAPGAAINYAATVNGQPVSTNVANHLAIACGNSPDPLRPFLGIAGITHSENIASANYNALQVGATHYFGRLNGSMAYTFGHSLDDASDGGIGAEIPNAYNVKGSRATSNFDEKHVLEISLVYDLPFFSKPGLLHSTLGGWQISDLTGFQTGTPFSISNTSSLSQSDNAGTGNTVSAIGSYPNIVGNIHAAAAIKRGDTNSGPRLYNSDAYALPQGLTYGDAGRNILRIPKRTNYDMGLFKNFAVREDMHFEFRAEAFNIFNHTQWSAINSSACYGADACAADPFLTATAAHNARILQFAGKFVF